MITNANATAGRSPRTAIQKAALAMGLVFLLVGVLGFVPGVTTQYYTLGPAGRDSMAMLLGLFMVSVLHNGVHLLFGGGRYRGRAELHRSPRLSAVWRPHLRRVVDLRLGHR